MKPIYYILTCCLLGVSFGGYSQGVTASGIGFKELRAQTDSFNIHWFNLHYNQYRKCSKYSKKDKSKKSNACYLDMKNQFETHLKLDTLRQRTSATMYESLITKADILFSSKKWTLSKEYYKKAMLVKPEEKYPKDKIVECNNLL